MRFRSGISPPSPEFIRRTTPFLLAGLITVGAAMVLRQADVVARLELAQAERTEVHHQLEMVRNRLQVALTAPLVRTRGMVAQIVAHGDVSPQVFARVAEVLLRGHHNVRAFVVSRGTTVEMIYPPDMNRNLIGADYRDIPNLWPAVQRAVETHSPVLQGPLDLIEDGIEGSVGLIVRDPIYLPATGDEGTRFFGIVTVILDIPKVFAEVGIGRPDLPIRLSIRGRDGLGASGDMIAGEPAVFGDDPVEEDLPLPYGSWRLAATPKNGWNTGTGALTRIRLIEASLFIVVAFIAFGAAHHFRRKFWLEGELSRALAKSETMTLDLRRKNADLERFMEVLAHHLQEPVRLQHAFAQRLYGLFPAPLPEQRQALDFIMNGAARQHALLRDFQRFMSLGDAPVAGTCHAEMALTMALDALGAKIDASGAVVERTSMPRVMVDCGRLAEVFTEVLDNAMLHRHPDRKPTIGIEAVIRGHEAFFAISDNGTGIPPEFHERVFRMFERLHSEPRCPGTGIGLSIARRIIDSACGRMWIETAPENGTRVCFVLPIAKE